MYASFGLLIGIVIGVMALRLTRSSHAQPGVGGVTSLGRLVLTFGTVAAVTLAVAIAASDGTLLYLVSILAGSAAVVMGVGALVRHERLWATWAGLVLGGIPSILWFVFAIGSMMSPP